VAVGCHLAGVERPKAAGHTAAVGRGDTQSDPCSATNSQAADRAAANSCPLQRHAGLRVCWQTQQQSKGMCY
jgi:hypothetical protein